MRTTTHLVPLIAAALSLSASLANADFLVTDGLNDQILLYDDDGQNLGPFIAPGSGGLNAPFAMTWGPDGNLYVGGGPISARPQQLLVYDGATGAFLRSIPAAPPSYFWVSLAFAPNGDLIAGDANSVRRLDPGSGALIARVGQGLVDYVGDAVPLPDGRLLLGTGGGGAAYHRLFAMDLNSNDIEVFADDSRLASCVGIGYRPDGTLYGVNDGGDEDVYRLDPATGQVLGLFARNDVLGSPADLLFVSGDGLWLSSVLEGRLAKFDAVTGDYLYSVPGPSSAYDMLYYPEPGSAVLFCAPSLLVRRRKPIR